MDLYRIRIYGHQKTDKRSPEEWGAFKARKTFDIEKKRINIKTGKNIYEKTNVSGFIVQYVTKKADVYVVCKDNIVKKITNIDKFTNDQVKFMNHNYTELFPVIDGKSVCSDIFSNGHILTYEFENGDKKWYSNDDPPTFGTITQKGVFYFIPDEKKKVEDVINAINNNNNNNNNNNINKIIKIQILGLEWSISKQFPTNNLPYRAGEEDLLLRDKNQSNIKIHTVITTWGGIEIPFNTNTVNKNKALSINSNSIVISTIE